MGVIPVAMVGLILVKTYNKYVYWAMPLLKGVLYIYMWSTG